MKDAKNVGGASITELLIAKPQEYQAGKAHAIPFVCLGNFQNMLDDNVISKAIRNDYILVRFPLRRSAIMIK